MKKKKIIAYSIITIVVVLLISMIVIARAYNVSFKSSKNDKSSILSSQEVNKEVNPFDSEDSTNEVLDLTDTTDDLETTVEENSESKTKLDSKDESNNITTNTNQITTNNENISNNNTNNNTNNTDIKLYGDVNNDSIINGKDVTLIRRYISGAQEFSENQKLLGDVNLDNSVDDVDVEIIRKYIAGGYIDKLPYSSGGKYTITYDLNGGSLNDYNIKTYAAISLPFTLSNPTKDGYVFSGWTGSNGSTPQITLTIPNGTTGNLKYNANWILYGDINNDGIVNSKDTTLIRRYISGTTEFTAVQKLAADLNSDGIVNDNDTDIIRQYIIGDINKLPIH